MKNKLILMIVFAIIVTSTIPINSLSYQDDGYTINIIIAKENFSFYYLESDVHPVLRDDTTLVPLRHIAEEFQFDVKWNEAEQSITVSKNEKEIKMWLDNNVALVNGDKTILNTSPMLLNERTMIPLRYVCEFFELKVLWKEYSENNAYIWLSQFELLKNDDVIPNDNYYRLDEDVPYYVLSNGGETARGIKIGDSYDTVLKLYGTPHKSADNNTYIEYYSPYLPNSSSGCTLIFYFENENVSSIELDY